MLGIALSAPPVLAALLLEIDSGVVALMGAGYVAHLGMTVWDVAYADGRRTIVPLEQHVHALLEVLPFAALSLVSIAHREQTLALVRLGRGKPRFGFRPKRKPPHNGVLLVAIVTFAITVAAPYTEELLRCIRYERKRAILGPNSPCNHRQIERSEK